MHLQTSIADIVRQGEFPSPYGLPMLKTDRFTDLLMLNLAWCNDEKHPVEASMMNLFFYPKVEETLSEASTQLTSMPREQLQLTEYSRYWHGTQCLLRPLLVLTDYGRLIVINIIVLSLLALWSLYEVWRHCSPSVGIAFAIVLLLAAFPAVPLCIQYSVCFYIMFLCIIYLLRHEEQGHYASTFFTTGALTAYFDLLTTPLLTLGIPLLICLHNSGKAVRTRRVAQLSACWAVGYVVFWLSKCMVAWLLTGHDIMGAFMEEAVKRSLFGLHTISQSIASHPYLYIAAAVMTCFLIYIGVRWLRQSARSSTFLGRHGWLLLVAAMPILWYGALLEHTVIHFFFTWRMLAITLMAIMLLCLDLRQTTPQTETYHDE